MPQKRTSICGDAERTALVAGIAGAVGLLAGGEAAASPVVNATATGGAVVSWFGTDASHAAIGIDLLDTNGPGFGTGADLVLYASPGGAFGVFVDSAFGFLVVDTPATPGVYWAHKFDSPAQIPSFAGGHLLPITFSSAGLFSSLSTHSWAGSTGYIGFLLAGPGPATYGWVELDVNGTLTSATILAWSPQTADNGADKARLAAVGTPEPAAAGLGLLALGAAGVLRHKRRRRDS